MVMIFTLLGSAVLFLTLSFINVVQLVGKLKSDESIRKEEILGCLWGTGFLTSCVMTILATPSVAVLGG